MTTASPILIAECCQNHNGDREILRRMIHEAAGNGADYVKIQAIRSRDLTRRERFEDGATDSRGQTTTIKRPYEPELQRLQRLDLSIDDELWFVDECRRAGVAAMTTVFTRTAAREVKDMGFQAVKIASYDCPSYPLLRDVARWWKTIVVSTGACYDAEIAQAAEVLAGVDLTLLHCVTIYPTKLEDFHLRRMEWLRRFTTKVGLSDHSEVAVDGIWASKIALALGADCIERHFTVLAADQTRDGRVSITPQQLRELREFANRSRRERMQIVSREFPRWDTLLGESTRDMTQAELLNRDYYRGRFASKIGGREIYNWEEVDIDAMEMVQV
ncbi:MAG TPA: N-acetylneuraminate synthase family protein [Gemmatimonadaceae bacterium]|nr:N-acetylneuraminate synthase family protein [Gemmatimonadaceae bacterium]